MRQFGEQSIPEKDFTDANTFFKGTHASFQQNTMRPEYEIRSNIRDFANAFEESYQALDLKNIPKTLSVQSVPELEIEPVARTIHGRKGNTASALNGVLVTSAIRETVLKKPVKPKSLKVLYVTSSRGPIQWFTTKLKQLGVALELVVISETDEAQQFLIQDAKEVKSARYYKVSEIEDVILDESFDVVFVHSNIHKIVNAGLMEGYLNSVRPGGVLSGTFPNASRISVTHGRDYLGMDEKGCSVTASAGDFYHDKPVDFRGVDPRLTVAPLGDMASHPYHGGTLPLGQGPHTATDAVWFMNVLPPKVQLPRIPYFSVAKHEEFKASITSRDVWKLGDQIDHPVPASFQSLISQGTHFLVKRKEDGVTLMMYSSLDGKTAVCRVQGKNYLLSGEFPVTTGYVISQWELMPNGSLEFSRVCSLVNGNTHLPYNFKQLLYFCAPEYISKFVASHSGLADLKVEEGYVLTSPTSMQPNVRSQGKIGTSMHVKAVQTIDIMGPDKTIIEVKVPEVGVKFDINQHKLRDRPDKVRVNSKDQLYRIREAITVENFLLCASSLGTVFPAAHQVPVFKDLIALRDRIIIESKNYQNQVSDIAGQTEMTIKQIDDLIIAGEGNDDGL